MNKKLIGLTIFLSFIIILTAACGSKSTESGQDANPNTSNSDTQVEKQAEEINVIMIADPWVDVISEFGKKYEQETGIKVNVEAYGHTNAKLFWGRNNLHPLM